MAAAAVPAISLGAGYFMNRGANRRTTATLQSGAKGLQDSASTLSGTGAQLGARAGGFLGDAQQSLTRASGSVGAASNYFSPILSGSRGAMDQALAPDRAMITDTYRGAERGLRDVRGGTGDLARAELNRDRAGRLSLLGPSARASAANGMLQVGGAQGQIGATQAGVGTNLFGQSVSAHQGAANAQGNLFSGGNWRDAQNQAGNRESSSAIGSMIFDAIRSRGSKPGGGNLPTSGGMNLAPFAPTVPMNRP